MRTKKRQVGASDIQGSGQLRMRRPTPRLPLQCHPHAVPARCWHHVVNTRRGNTKKIMQGISRFKRG